MLPPTLSAVCLAPTLVTVATQQRVAAASASSSRIPQQGTPTGPPSLSRRTGAHHGPTAATSLTSTLPSQATITCSTPLLIAVGMGLRKTRFSRRVSHRSAVTGTIEVAALLRDAPSAISCQRALLEMAAACLQLGAGREATQLLTTKLLTALKLIST